MHAESRPDIRSPSSEAYLLVRNATKKYGALTVLEGVDLEVKRGEFVSLLGPSGCGKTTLLRLIAGLAPIDGGSIRLGGRDLSTLPAHRRNIGMVFQSYALFPHLTVAENVAFGLKARGAARAEVSRSVAELLDLVRMADFSDRPIQALSGGQQQRIAVARALAIRPDLLLFDEPFSALDRKLRETMEIELRRLLRELEITAVFVTHDQEEALVMSDRIAVMNRGVIEQFAEPATVYSKPATTFTLEFVGMSTRLRGRVSEIVGSTVVVDTRVGRIQARAPESHPTPPGTAVLVGVRPDKLSCTSMQDKNNNQIEIELLDQVFLGSKRLLHFDAPEGDVVVVEAQSGHSVTAGRGERIDICWGIEDTLIFPLDA